RSNSSGLAIGSPVRPKLAGAVSHHLARHDTPTVSIGLQPSLGVLGQINKPAAVCFVNFRTNQNLVPLHVGPLKLQKLAFWPDAGEEPKYQERQQLQIVLKSVNKHTTYLINRNGLDLLSRTYGKVQSGNRILCEISALNAVVEYRAQV